MSVNKKINNKYSIQYNKKNNKGLLLKRTVKLAVELITLNT